MSTFVDMDPVKLQMTEEDPSSDVIVGDFLLAFKRLFLLFSNHCDVTSVCDINNHLYISCF